MHFLIAFLRLIVSMRTPKALLVLIALSVPAWAAGERVYVVGPSVSTRLEARRIVANNRWIESRPRQADFVLVVVRSEFTNPLNGFYGNLEELERGAGHQLNIVGSNFVVYLFRLDDDLHLTQLKHTTYAARD